MPTTGRKEPSVSTANHLLVGTLMTIDHVTMNIAMEFPHLDVSSLVRCVDQNRSTRQVARQKHGYFFLVTPRACPQATLSETNKENVKRRRRRGHLATSVTASVGLTLKVITEILNAEIISTENLH